MTDTLRTIRPPTGDEVRELAAAYGIDLTETERRVFAETIPDVLETYDRLDEIPSETPPVSYPDRDLGIAILANVSPPYLVQAVGEGVLAIVLDGDDAELTLGRWRLHKVAQSSRLVSYSVRAFCVYPDSGESEEGRPVEGVVAVISRFQ